MADETAADDELFVCCACGKTSTTRYGLGGTAMPGWDESCMLNARRFKAALLTRNASGRVTSVAAPTPTQSDHAAEETATKEKE